MSVLRPETIAVLRGVRASDPLHRNMMVAEAWEGEHTRGELTVLPGADGQFVVFDRGAAFGKGELARLPTVAAAHDEVERLAAARILAQPVHVPPARGETMPVGVATSAGPPSPRLSVPGRVRHSAPGDRRRAEASR